MQALEGIDGLFGAHERARGRAYFLGGLVRLEQVSDESACARVKGSRWYDVSITAGGAGWSLMCTCPAFERESVCKHLYATVLAARARASAPVRARPARPAAWLSLLDELDPPEPHTAALQLRYVLCPSAAVPTLPPQLETHASRMGARGHALPYRPMAVQPAQRAGLDPEDRAILAPLWGAEVERSWHVHLRSTASVPLPVDLQSELLPRIARCGRLFLRSDDAREVCPLALDDGPALKLVVTLSTERAALRLGACLRQGKERLALADCEALLEGGLCVARGALRRVDWHGLWPWVEPLRSGARTSIPRAQLARVLDLLARLPAGAALEAPDFVEDVAAPVRGLLRLIEGPRGRDVLRAQICFSYAGELLPRRSRHFLARRGERLLRIARDPAGEARLVAEFEAAGGVPAQDFDGLVPLAVFPALVRALQAVDWRIEAEGRPVRSAGEPALSVRSGIDWFELDARVRFDDLEIGLPELLRAIDARECMVVLADGSRGLLPERWLASLALARRLGEEHEGVLRVERERAWLLDAWLAEQPQVDADEAFAKACTFFRRARSVEARPEPAGFRGELRAYQREGLGWLAFLSEIGVGGCLADDMGLGKTVQVLALLLERRARARGPALVVAPLSVLFNWVREAQRFTPGLDVVLHHGPARARSTARLEDADLVVTSYGTLRRDAALLARLELDCAVLDEAQSIKNEASLSARAACALRAELRLALTGTPVENHLGELYSIFAFLAPGLIGRGLRATGILERGLDDLEAARFVARALRPFLLRRTKEEVLPELPAKTEQVLACELEGAERRAYDELRDHFRRELLAQADAIGLERMQMNVLEALLRLRQAACHPGLLDERRAGEDSAKLAALLPLLDEVRESGHKALVFSQFTSFLAILRRRLDAQGIAYEYLDGRTRKREEHVRRFQEDARVPLFLISLKAGGAGLNLTAADYVFLLDPWWNPAVEAQAIDRTHRIGQTRAVTAYRLVARDTVEEKVLELQQRKRALAQALFEGAAGGGTLRDLTRADLEWILG